MYICEECGSEFEFPRIRISSELIDGENREWRKEVSCPICGGAHFRPMETADFDY